MSLDLDKAKQPRQKRNNGRVEEGTHPARIVGIVDLGLQHMTDYVTQKPRYHVLDDKGNWAKKGDQYVFTTEENDAPDLKYLVNFTFEFPTERVDIPVGDNTVSKPRWLSKEYPFSSDEKSGLMKLIKALKPDAKKIGTLINMPCLVSVGTTSGGNAKIENVGKILKGMKVDELENDSFVFSTDEPDVEEFKKMPKFMQKKILGAVNFSKTAAAKMDLSFMVSDSKSNDKADDSSGDDIPFDD